MNLKERKNGCKQSIDCIIFGIDEDGLKILLTKKKNANDKFEWRFIGGIKNEEENAITAAERLSFLFTGLKNINPLEIFKRNQNVSGHKTEKSEVKGNNENSLTVAIKPSKTYEFSKSKLKRYRAKWFDISEMPVLGQSKNELVNQSIKKIVLESISYSSDENQITKIDNRLALKNIESLDYTKESNESKESSNRSIDKAGKSLVAHQLVNDLDKEVLSLSNNNKNLVFLLVKNKRIF